MPITRYQYMARVHEIVKPEVYLEIGVQSGASLVLAAMAGLAIGVDPDGAAFDPVQQRDNQRRFTQTSDEYFACVSCERPGIDFGFVDGQHLIEYALRDFLNIEVHATKGAIIMFDDVLPYNQDIAWRHQPPGDWAGDVFKIAAIFDEHRPDLNYHLVDVSPTGALVVLNPDPRRAAEMLRKVDEIVEPYIHGPQAHYVPEAVLARESALTVEASLELIAKGR